MDLPTASIDAIVQAPILGVNNVGQGSDNQQVQIEHQSAQETNPKMKRRKRLLLSLNRISSSPSLAKMRPYRSSGRASMSCASLSSQFTSYTPYEQPSAVNSDTDVSQHYSTAPTSVANSPGPESPIFDLRPRTTATKEGLSFVSLPPCVRSLSPALSEVAIEELQEDYFSCAEVEQKPTRPDFHFWNDMPMELRFQILSHLTPRQIVQCSSVSKEWHDMCFDGQLWRKLDTTSYYQKISADALIKIISSAGPFVRDLNLRGCVQLQNKWNAANLPKACENLENFSLEGCIIDGPCVNDFLSRNSNLVHVNLSGLSAVNDKAMKVIARQCPKLEHLNVTWCSYVSTNGIQHVIDGCPGIKDLRAGEVRGWDDVDFCAKLFERNTLERLVLTNCDSLTDESLTALMVGLDGQMDYLTGRITCPPRKLKHLDLSRCRGISDRGAKMLAYNVPDLEGLQLAKCSNLTDESLTEIFPTLNVLTHLDLEELEGITNASLQSLANDSPSTATLRHLSVSYCEQVGDLGLLPILKKCRSLEQVDMDNTKVTDLVLIEVASRLREQNKRAATTASLLQQDKGSINVALKLVVYDCLHVTWNGILEILSRNAEVASSDGNLNYAHSIISLKAYYTWQPTINEHAKRLLIAKDFGRAKRLESKWKAFMIAGEEAGISGNNHRNGARDVSRRRRRRYNEAWEAMWDDENPPEGAAAAVGLVVGRRRARSGPGGVNGGSCSIM